MDFIQGSPQQAQSSAPAQEVAEMIPQQAQPQGIPAGGGLPQGTGLAEIEQDPRNSPDQEVEGDEQAQYEDLFIRVMSAVHDVRKAPKANKSMADNVVQMLASKDREPHESIGQTAGMTMTQMITMAKSQGKEYSPDVIREVGMDLVHEMYMIASKSGAIKNLPEDESKGYEAIINQSILEAVKFFGEQQIASGNVNQAAHMKELEHQMNREADSGELDNWGMEEFDEETRFGLAQRLKGGQNVA